MEKVFKFKLSFKYIVLYDHKLYFLGRGRPPKKIAKKNASSEADDSEKD